MEHYRFPRNKGELENADVIMKDSNTLCGDVVEFQIRFNGDKEISDLRFNGQGCIISQASASIFGEFVKNKSLNQIKDFSKEDFLKMLGIELGVNRIKCALLPFKVLKLCVYTYLGTKERENIEI